MTDKEKIEKLEKENKELREHVKKLKRINEKNIKDQNNSAWEFHWDGRGNYEEARRCFYGDFS